jgi:serine/threonine protein kinase
VTDTSFVVKLISHFKEKDRVYFCFEYCPHGDLSSYLAEHPHGLSEEEAGWLVYQIALGLAHLHALGIVHRDIKMDNILLAEGFTPKITDFGLSKREEMMQTYCGTPLCMAPEVFCEQVYTNKCDVWSLAVIWYELLTNSYAFGKVRSL